MKTKQATQSLKTLTRKDIEKRLDSFTLPTYEVGLVNLEDLIYEWYCNPSKKEAKLLGDISFYDWLSYNNLTDFYQVLEAIMAGLGLSKKTVITTITNKKPQVYILNNEIYAGTLKALKDQAFFIDL
jgi:hypothetical protein